MLDDLSREAAKLCTVRQASAVLELQGREHPERGVPANAVVEGLDVVEDLGGQLAAGRPGAAVKRQFFLERGEEALGDGVVVAVALGFPIQLSDPGLAGSLAEGQGEPSSDPWSLW